MVKTASTMPDLGQAAAAFSLPDTNGRTVSLSDFAGRPLLVMFICNHCPYVKHIAAGLAKLGQDYAVAPIGIVAINSNDSTAHPDDGPDAMSLEVTRRNYTFPYLFDQTQEVAKAYGAACTPDFFLYDGDHELVYRGQFDDARPGNEVAVSGADLRAAMDAVIDNTAVPSAQKPSIGCNIKWRPGNAPSWTGSGMT